MITMRLGHVLLALALVFAIIFSDRLVGSAQDEAAGTVGFIDLSKVLNSHDGLREVESQINELLKSGETEVAKAQEGINQLKDALMVYTPFSKEYIEQENKIELRDLELKQMKKALVMERDVKVGQALKQAYSDIERAVEEYARMNGFSAVLSFPPGIDQLNTDRPEDILKWVSMVDSVWHDDRLDISDAIITIVNGS